MNIGSISVYLTVASTIWIFIISTLWGLSPHSSPPWYNATISAIYLILAVSYLILSLALWIGFKFANIVVGILLILGGAGWILLSLSTISITDIITIILLLISALTVLMALRTKGKSTFHPLDYPVYG